MMVAEQLSGHLAVAFTVAVIAMMQGVVWHRDREPGTLWFAAGYAMTAVLALFNDAFPAGADVPNARFFLIVYVIRLVWSIGFVRYLSCSRPQQPFIVAALAAPSLFAAVALLGAAAAPRAIVGLPMVWSDVGIAILCIVARRRSPGAGHLMLALAMLTGPCGLLVALVTSVRPVLLREVYVWPAAIAIGIVVLVVTLMRNSRDSRFAHAQAQRISNFYKALSETNQAVLRIRDPAALYQAICTVCVESGHAQMACLYLSDGCYAHRAATAGPAEQILAGVPNPWDTSTPQARDSYTAQALREGVRLVCNDYQNDPRTANWRDIAIENDVRAMVWLPLKRNSKVVAVLMLSAAERGFFDEPLLKLLDGMTNDISFALDHLDSEAQRAESMREVQAGLERFSRLFQTAPVPAAIVSLADRRVVDVNQAMCERDAKPRGDFIGRETHTIAYGILPEDREIFYGRFRREGRVRNLVVRSPSKTGRLRINLINAEPLDYLDKACVLLMVLDITELREAEESRRALVEAQAANRAKTDFLSRMSHELRTPLNAILGFSALLRNDAAQRLTAVELEQLDHVQRAGWYLLRLIDDVLDLSRIEAGQLKIETRCLNLVPLLDDAVQMSQPLARQHAVRLHVDYLRAVPVAAQADSTRLRQVVLNVLSNAIKYNRAGGTVHLQVAQPDAESTVVEVRDSGLGMTEQQLAHLFEPFNRLGREQDGIEGTGIGLALTRQLMAMMDGSVTIDSRPGLGTVVQLRLPRGDERDAAQNTRPTALDDARGDAVEPTGSVLYIEDNTVNMLLIEQLLARWRGVRFHAAFDGRTGIEMVESVRPDLVLLDMQLPDLDGIQILHSLQGNASLRSTPVVVLSASALPEDMARARAAGATDYWTKPIDFNRFLSAVAELLNAR